jgi:hypothetical protein
MAGLKLPLEMFEAVNKRAMHPILARRSEARDNRRLQLSPSGSQTSEIQVRCFFLLEAT